jgi:hypothetical protein
MSHLKDLSAGSDSGSGLRAITINGSIHVESEEDLRRREERRKLRKSRWGRTADTVAQYAAPAPKRSSILLPEDAVGGGQQARSSAAASSLLRMPTMIDASAMDEQSQQVYLLQMQIQEASMKLARPDLGCPFLKLVEHNVF